MARKTKNRNQLPSAPSCPAVLVLLAFVSAIGCELEGYGLIRELADGSNDTTAETTAETNAGAEVSTEAVREEETAEDTVLSEDTATVRHIEAETDTGADTVVKWDTDTEIHTTVDTGEVVEADTNGCVLVCTLECDTGELPTDQAAEGDTDSGIDTGEPNEEGEDSETAGTIPVDTGSTDTETNSTADSGEADTAQETDPSHHGDTGVSGDPEAACVIISEYVEGSSRNKGVEIFNCGDAPVDLGSFSLCLVSNDNTECGTTLSLEGSLGTGEVLTICHTSAESIPNCDLRSGVANFSGDDRLILMDGLSIADAFGDAAERPDGTPWADTTLRRCNPTPYTGGLPFVVGDYYSVHDQDDFDDFGIPPSEFDCAL